MYPFIFSKNQESNLKLIEIIFMDRINKFKNLGLNRKDAK